MSIHRSIYNTPEEEMEARGYEFVETRVPVLGDVYIVAKEHYSKYDGWIVTHVFGEVDESIDGGKRMIVRRKSS